MIYLAGITVLYQLSIDMMVLNWTKMTMMLWVQVLELLLKGNYKDVTEKKEQVEEMLMAYFMVCIILNSYSYHNIIFHLIFCFRWTWWWWGFKKKTSNGRKSGCWFYCWWWTRWRSKITFLIILLVIHF